MDSTGVIVFAVAAGMTAAGVLLLRAAGPDLRDPRAVLMRMGPRGLALRFWLGGVGTACSVVLAASADDVLGRIALGANTLLLACLQLRAWLALPRRGEGRSDDRR